MLASARHPAMLAYLDNFQSIGPDVAPRRALGQRAGGVRASAGAARPRRAAA